MAIVAKLPPVTATATMTVARSRLAGGGFCGRFCVNVKVGFWVAVEAGVGVCVGVAVG
jgi:hypothetical protein